MCRLLDFASPEGLWSVLKKVLIMILKYLCLQFSQSGIVRISQQILLELTLGRGLDIRLDDLLSP